MENLIKKVRQIQDYFGKFEKILIERGNEPKYPITSLPKFNRKIWGLRNGITVVGGRTSQGKTSIVSTFAYDLADKGIHTLFISLETSDMVSWERALFIFSLTSKFARISVNFSLRLILIIPTTNSSNISLILSFIVPLWLS